MSSCSSYLSIMGSISAFMLFVSEIMPYLNYKQCNSITQVFLHFFRSNKCISVVEDANEALEKNNDDLTINIQTLKDEIINELRKELEALKTVRRSFEMQPIKEMT